MGGFGVVFGGGDAVVRSRLVGTGGQHRHGGSVARRGELRDRVGALHSTAQHSTALQTWAAAAAAAAHMGTGAQFAGASKQASKEASFRSTRPNGSLSRGMV
jgi:hypothetical protein